MRIPKPPKVSFNLLRKAVLFVFIISVSIAIGYFFGAKGYNPADIPVYPSVTINREVPQEVGNLDFSLFWKVWDTLHLKYYDKTKLIDSNMVYGAIGGMVNAIGDPYTAFLPPAENKVIEEDLKGSFDGIGIQIGFRDKTLAVMAPLPGSPAEKAGVMAGDYIIAIKDLVKGEELSTQGMSLNDAVQAIRGEKGTKVELTLIRDGKDEPIKVEIARDIIDVPSIVVNYYEDDTIADVQVLKFTAEMQSEWNEKVAELLMKENLKGIIIDVRNNPGGYMQGAVDLASDFLETGDVVVIEEGAKGIRNEYKVERIGRFRKIKMVVLINKGSASASEIFSGAMKDHKRATLVGDISFGKGTIQEPEQVDDNGAGLHITIARWLTPSGYWVNEQGLKPDIEVANNPDTGEDEQLDKALELLKM